MGPVRRPGSFANLMTRRRAEWTRYSVAGCNGISPAAAAAAAAAAANHRRTSTPAEPRPTDTTTRSQAPPARPPSNLPPTSSLSLTNSTTAGEPRTGRRVDWRRRDKQRRPGLMACCTGAARRPAARGRKRNNCRSHARTYVGDCDMRIMINEKQQIISAAATGAALRRAADGSARPH